MSASGNRWIAPDVFAYLENSEPFHPRIENRYRYYHEDNTHFFQAAIAPGSRVLIIGCRIAALASTLRDCEVLRFELGPYRNTTAPLQGVADVHTLEEAAACGPIDYVLLPYTLQYLDDIQAFLDALRPLLKSAARLIVLNYNFAWAPLLRLAQRIHLRMSTPALNWLNPADTRGALELTRYQVVQSRNRCLIPFYLPFVSAFINQFVAPLPLFNFFCQKQFFVARPRLDHGPEKPAYSCSVIVPARNEKGNIGPLLDRLPVLGTYCEIVFVEGHSRDDTWQEIKNQMAIHPRATLFRIQTWQQSGIGKADAVALGFAKATGDIVMILDADLTVQPEDLPHFFQPLALGVGEFMNGSRLVYKMEKAAMQLLNLFFNKLFGIWMSWILGQTVKDTLCGTKALFRQDYHRMARYVNEISPWDPFGDFKLLLAAGRMHLKIFDVPVRYRERTYGSTNISRFRHGWQLFRTCLIGWGKM